MMTDLEQRISSALTADGLSSAELSALCTETEDAINAADAEAAREREAAFDPALRPDPQAARQAMEDASFAANRLRTLLPRLGRRHAEAQLAEDRAAFEKDYLAVDALQAEVSERHTRRYPALFAELMELIDAIKRSDAEIARVNHAASAIPGEQRRLRPAPFPCDIVRLPDPRDYARTWPPPEPPISVAFVQQMQQMVLPRDPRRFTDRWWEAAEEDRQRAAQRDAERVAEQERADREAQDQYYAGLAQKRAS